MARPKKTAGGSPTDYQLVNVHFNDKERAEFIAWADGLEGNVENDLLDIADGGFKVSFSRDNYNETYVTSLTAKTPINVKLKNHVFVIRHSDPIKCMALAAYTFRILLRGGEQQLPEMEGEHSW